MRSFVPHLVAQGTGHVVNTSSMAGLMTVPGIAPYTAAKRAVVGMSETLAAELADHAPGVGVTVACPGRVVSRLGVSSELTRPGGNPSAAAGDADTDAQLDEPGIITAAENATQVIAAMEAGRLHVAPGTGTTRLAKRHVDQLGESLGF
jgi:short-subunit dehydrogenase